MAAKTKSSKDVSKKIINTKVSRPGIHSKKRNSVLKSSKNWKKPYRGQGR